MLKLLFTVVICLVLMGGLAAVVSNGVMIFTTQGKIVSEKQAAAFNADAIVVLGASVTPQEDPSPILQDRLDVAVQLYWDGAAPKIIVSGTSEPGYNEPAAMKRYVVSQGVPSSDVFCDYAGYTSYETMYRAKHVFGCNRVVVVTQTYHLYRCLYCAEGVGLQAVGVNSDLHEYSKQNFYNAREVLARTKDFIQVLLKTPATVSTGSIDLNRSGDFYD